MLFGSVIPRGGVSIELEARDCGPVVCEAVIRLQLRPCASHVYPTMTTEFTPKDELSSPEEFEATLGRVIRSALESDIDPVGTWEYRPETGSDMEVMIVELADGG